MTQEISFIVDGKTYTIAVQGPIFRTDMETSGAKITKSLLITDDPYDVSRRTYEWNKNIDLIESGIVAFVANGGNIVTSAFVEMIKCQLIMLVRRLEM